MKSVISVLICCALIAGAAPLAAMEMVGPSAGSAMSTGLEPAAAAGAESYCFAEARCENGKAVTCEGWISCYARDHGCPYFDGYVRCDGVTVHCPVCINAPDYYCPIAGRECQDQGDCIEPGDPDCLDCECMWDGDGRSKTCHCPE